jgi:hypothetical protein
MTGGIAPLLNVTGGTDSVKNGEFSWHHPCGLISDCLPPEKRCGSDLTHQPPAPPDESAWHPSGN